MSTLAPVCVLHGISEGGDVEQRGLVETVRLHLAEHVARAYAPARPPEISVQGLYWANIAKAYERALTAELATALQAARGALPPLLAAGIDRFKDYILDVVCYAGERKEHILDVVEAQIWQARKQSSSPLALYAHSLGSVIAVDLLLRWASHGLLTRLPEHEWPIRSLVTTGSPLGVDVPFAKGIGYRDRAERLATLAHYSPAYAAPLAKIKWYNLYDKNDWIVKGSPLAEAKKLRHAGYPVRAEQTVECGVLLDAHTKYHENTVVLQTLYGAML